MISPKIFKTSSLFIIGIILTLGLSISTQSVLATIFETMLKGIKIGDSSLQLPALTDNLFYGLISATNANGSLMLLQTGSGADKFRVDKDGNVTAARGITSFGGKEPLKFTLGNPNEQATWLHTEKDLQDYCFDEDGCRIKLYLQHELNDLARTITEEIFTEQTSISGDHVTGLYGYTRQSGGGEYGWRLGVFNDYYTIFNPWDWIWAFNYLHENVNGGNNSAAFTGADIYKFSFMVHPHVTATIIVYDN